MANRFTAIIIVFNAIMGLFLFLSNQLVLLDLRGLIIQQVGISFIYTRVNPSDFPPNVNIDTAPQTNFPFYVFLLSLIVNVCFLIILQRSKETKQNPS
jgi:hypothetical protein